MNEPTSSLPAPAARRSGWQSYVKDLIARELSTITRYCDRVIQLEPLPTDPGDLLERLDCPARETARDMAAMPDWSSAPKALKLAVLISGTFNHHYDIQGVLSALKPKLARSSRVLVVAYNPYLSFLYRLANALGLRKGEQPSTFLTATDFRNIAALSGYELVRARPVGYFPYRLLGLGSLINRGMPWIPLLRHLAVTQVISLRPILRESARPSLTVVIPARNERGNLESALRRMPDFGAPLEVIFVEGHSSDGTWEEIQRLLPLYADRFTLQAYRQTGTGKNDAVRLGFAHATGELVTILDADLTMPPELLTRFYDAYCEGLADFINGSRLVYPMEGDAMRFLNRLGNVFFAKALSTVLDSRIGDSLCGTKLLRRDDYQRIARWRADFGDFDPFGDFELLFPAAVFSLGIIDVPIRYLARTYGTTNIKSGR